jgi:Flp pilus assembly protein TadG
MEGERRQHAPTGRSVRRRLLREQAGFVVGFLLRTFLAFALLGLVVEEAGQIVVAQIHASDAAGTAAQAAADDWAAHHDAQDAERAALAALADKDPQATMTAFSIDRSGAATVTVEEQANTLIVRHLSPLRGLGIQHATEVEVHSLA